MQNNIKVLVATPVISGSKWEKNALDIFNNLSFENKVSAIFTDEIKDLKYPNKYTKNSVARNRLIEQFLTNDITHVLWIDADIVVYPNDLIERLLSIESENIIAPFPLIEKCEESEFKYERFYDIDFFIGIDGNKFNYKFPYCPNLIQKNGKYEMLSVGTCYLMPSKPFFDGIKFYPYDVRGDHIPMLEKCIENGYKIYSTDSIYVEHAYLPKYGEKFH
jgi:hypothetical protein